MWPKYKETHNIEVRYYPPERGTRYGEGLDIGGELIEVLSRITVQEGESQSLPIFATDYSRRIIDDAVAVSVTYKTEGFIEQEQPAQSMGGFVADIQPKE